MGRTACTEPQCLYKGALYLTLSFYTFNAIASHAGGYCFETRPRTGCSNRPFTSALLPKQKSFYYESPDIRTLPVILIEILRLSLALSGASPISL